MEKKWFENKDIHFTKECDNLLVSSPQKTDYYNVIICLEGSMHVRVGYHVFEIYPKTISIISPDTIYFSQPITSEIKVVQVMFRKPFLQKMLLRDRMLDELLYLNANYPPLYKLEKAYNQVISLFYGIEQELTEKAPYHLDIVRLKLIEILYEYNRACEFCLLGFKKGMNRQYQLTYQFKQLVDEKYKDLKTVQDYASIIGVTAKHLTEVVKEETGQTALHIIHERIILEAKYLLKHTTAPVKECAYTLGYEDMSYFARFFKANTGYSPTYYREK